MSTRKISVRVNTNSPVTTSTSSELNNTPTSSSTLSQSPTKSSPTSLSPSSLSTKSSLTTATTESNLQPSVKDIPVSASTLITSAAILSNQSDSKKRRRRTSVLGSPSLIKKIDENDETILSTNSDTIVDDDGKSLKTTTSNDEEIKDVKDDNVKEKEPIVESPARSRRRKLYENKIVTSPMVTRKTTMDCVRNTRSLRCIRRDSQGKLEGVFEICPPKRPYNRRKTNSTPELSTPTKRKKDEIGKDEDDSLLLQKKIKIEKVDIEEEIEKIEDDESIKEEDDEEKSITDEMIKTDTLDSSTLVGDTDTSSVITPIQDNTVHDGVLEESIENQEENRIVKEIEKSDENNDSPLTTGPQKETRARGRPRRIKPENEEEKSTPPKKTRKVKPPVERKIQPRRSVTMKLRKSIEETVEEPVIKEEINIDDLEETKETVVTGIEEPLNVDTNIASTTEKEQSSSASCGETSEKAASLSPDLISEGVNVQSVKDFYKKPEFLENNRGIENDPNLGGIVVQNVEQNEEEGEDKDTEKLAIEENDINDNEKDIIEKETENDVIEIADETQITEGDDEVTIVDVNSQNSADVDTTSTSKTFDTYGKDNSKISEIEKDETEISGSGDSLKESDILLVLEDSNEEEEIESKISLENVLENDTKVEKTESKNETEISKDIENTVNTEDDNLNKSPVMISVSKETKDTELDLKTTCDSAISSNNNDVLNSSTSDVISKKLSSNNSGSISDSNRAVDKELVIDDTTIKDNKINTDPDINHDIKEIENEDDSSMIKDNEISQTEATEENLMKEDEKIEIKDQLNLQMEVDSGISDAVTESNEDISMQEINYEVKNIECLNKTNTENVKCDLITTTNSKESNKKSIKKLKEERDSKKTEKIESELPTLQNKVLETPETLRQKEDHLKSLGLLTHKAAVEAENEKQRRRKQLKTNLISNLTNKKNGNSSGSCSNSGSGSSSSSSSTINIENGRSIGDVGIEAMGGGQGVVGVAGGSNGSHQYSMIGGNYHKNSEQYTGTLKTVIKLNRQSNTANAVSETKRKSTGNGNNSSTSNNGNGNGNLISSTGNGNSIAIASTSSGSSNSSSNSNCNEGRQSLKMTFQKGRGRPPNSQKDAKDSGNSGEETYYTIQNENEGSQPYHSVSHGRKSYNRSHTTTVDTNHTTTVTTTTTAPTATATAVAAAAAVTTITANTSTEQTQDQPSEKIEEKELILIPEKASSFGIHPGRLCQDQCFYCGGRFGLYDTPCHVAQLKSEERKQKILANEEKLTIDNCLCDACFRHVVRRAKDSSYKPRTSAPAVLETSNANNSSQEDVSEVIVQDDVTILDETQPSYWSNVNKGDCFVPDCKNKSSHSLRRKCIRKTIKKLIPNFDLSKIGTTAPICEKHYNAIIQFLGCALCKRRLGKNHMQYINQDSERLGKLLEEQGIPVKLANNSAVCKLCRYFVNLLLKPPDHGKLQKEQFVKNYRRRLLHFHNIQSDETSDVEEQPPEKKKDENSEKKEKTAVEEVTVTKSKRGRKPKNQSTTVNTSSTALPQSSESEKSTSNVGTGSNSPQSSDENGEKLLQPVSLNTNTMSGQIILDNDVMVDYDMPVPLDTPSPPATAPPSTVSITQSAPPPPAPAPAPPIVQQQQQPQQQQQQQQSSIASKLQSILQSNSGGSSSSSSSSTPKEDISIVLRSNPNISMRELFPGEEEMGLQMNVPFGSSQSYRTPEGWTRVQTFLQYDEPTRRLWENLQKPYGNQSSFLRHLILLEKYFRNGDLVLSHNASENATVYSETVRNRLRSYDNTDDNKASNDNNEVVDITKSLLDKIPKHVSNLPITITTKPKPQSQSASNSSSTNDSFSSSNNTSNRKSSGPSAGDSILKSNLLAKKPDSVEIVPISSGNDNNGGNSGGSNSGGMTKQQKLLAAASRLMGNGEGNSSSTISNQQQQQHQQQQQQQQQHHHHQQQQLPLPPPEPKKSMPNNGINLPPQLISINRGQNNSNNSNSIMNRSRSNDHHIHRRKQIPPNVIVLPDTLTPTERLQSKNWRPTLMPVSQAGHLRQPGGPLYQTADGRRLPALVQVQSGGQPYLISIHDYNRMCILRREKMREQIMKNRNLSQQFTAQQNKSQYMGRHSDPTMSSVSGGGPLSSRNSQHSLKTPSQQTSLLKSSLASGPGGGLNSTLTSKLLGTSPQLQIVPQISTSQQQMNSTSPNNTVSIIPASLASNMTVGGPLITPSTIGNMSTSWLWNNVNGGNNSAIKNMLPFNSNQIPSTSASSISPLKQQQLPPPPPPHQQQFSLSQHNNAPPLILDNSLLSKIPKSLTVIPQQKPHGNRSRGSSIDDLTSA